MLLAPLLAAFALAAISFSASAGPGHNHDGEGPAPTDARTLPRFSAASETFELVGILDGRRLTLFLDRYADNTPVTDAWIELDLGGGKLQPKPVAGGWFELMLAEVPRAGVIPVVATVSAGAETDLLAADLDLHDTPTIAAAGAHVHGARTYAAWIAGAVAAFGLLALLYRRMRRVR